MARGCKKIFFVVVINYKEKIAITYKVRDLSEYSLFYIAILALPLYQVVRYLVYCEWKPITLTNLIQLFCADWTPPDNLFWGIFGTMQLSITVLIAFLIIYTIFMWIKKKQIEMRLLGLT